MPELIAKDVHIYRFPVSGPSGAETPFSILRQSNAKYAVGILKVDDSDIAKSMERVSEGHVFIDRLYSISDLRIDWSKIDEVKKKLPISYHGSAVEDKEFEKRYGASRDKFESGSLGHQDFDVFVKDMDFLHKLRKRSSLNQNDMIYMLQLTGDGWVNYMDAAVTWLYPSDSALKNLKRYKLMGLVDFTTFNDESPPYYVKLTSHGVDVQNDLKRMIGQKD